MVLPLGTACLQFCFCLLSHLTRGVAVPPPPLTPLPTDGTGWEAALHAVAEASKVLGGCIEARDAFDVAKGRLLRARQRCDNVNLTGNGSGGSGTGVDVSSGNSGGSGGGDSDAGDCAAVPGVRRQDGRAFEHCSGVVGIAGRLGGGGC